MALLHILVCSHDKKSQILWSYMGRHAGMQASTMNLQASLEDILKLPIASVQP